MAKIMETLPLKTEGIIVNNITPGLLPYNLINIEINNEIWDNVAKFAYYNSLTTETSKQVLKSHKTGYLAFLNKYEEGDNVKLNKTVIDEKIRHNILSSNNTEPYDFELSRLLDLVQLPSSSENGIDPTEFEELEKNIKKYSKSTNHEIRCKNLMAVFEKTIIIQLLIDNMKSTNAAVNLEFMPIYRLNKGDHATLQTTKDSIKGIIVDISDSNVTFLANDTQMSVDIGQLIPHDLVDISCIFTLSPEYKTDGESKLNKLKSVHSGKETFMPIQGWYRIKASDGTLHKISRDIRSIITELKSNTKDITIDSGDHKLKAVWENMITKRRQQYEHPLVTPQETGLLDIQWMSDIRHHSQIFMAFAIDICLGRQIARDQLRLTGTSKLIYIDPFSLSENSSIFGVRADTHKGKNIVGEILMNTREKIQNVFKKEEESRQKVNIEAEVLRNYKVIGSLQELIKSRDIAEFIDEDVESILCALLGGVRVYVKQKENIDSYDIFYRPETHIYAKIDTQWIMGKKNKNIVEIGDKKYNVHNTMIRKVPILPFELSLEERKRLIPINGMSTELLDMIKPIIQKLKPRDAETPIIEGIIPLSLSSNFILPKKEIVMDMYKWDIGRLRSMILYEKFNTGNIANIIRKKYLRQLYDRRIEEEKEIIARTVLKYLQENLPGIQTFHNNRNVINSVLIEGVNGEQWDIIKTQLNDQYLTGNINSLIEDDDDDNEDKLETIIDNEIEKKMYRRRPPTQDVEDAESWEPQILKTSVHTTQNHDQESQDKHTDTDVTPETLNIREVGTEDLEIITSLMTETEMVEQETIKGGILDIFREQLLTWDPKRPTKIEQTIIDEIKLSKDIALWNTARKEAMDWLTKFSVIRMKDIKEGEDNARVMSKRYNNLKTLRNLESLVDPVAETIREQKISNETEIVLTHKDAETTQYLPSYEPDVMYTYNNKHFPTIYHIVFFQWMVKNLDISEEDAYKKFTTKDLSIEEIIELADKTLFLSTKEAFNVTINLILQKRYQRIEKGIQHAYEILLEKNMDYRDELLFTNNADLHIVTPYDINPFNEIFTSDNILGIDTKYKYKSKNLAGKALENYRSSFEEGEYHLKSRVVEIVELLKKCYELINDHRSSISIIKAILEYFSVMCSGRKEIIPTVHKWIYNHIEGKLEIPELTNTIINYVEKINNADKKSICGYTINDDRISENTRKMAISNLSKYLKEVFRTLNFTTKDAPYFSEELINGSNISQGLAEFISKIQVVNIPSVFREKFVTGEIPYHDIMNILDTGDISKVNLTEKEKIIALKEIEQYKSRMLFQ